MYPNMRVRVTHDCKSLIVQPDQVGYIDHEVSDLSRVYDCSAYIVRMRNGERALLFANEIAIDEVFGPSEVNKCVRCGYPYISTRWPLCGCIPQY